ncbi:guanylate kinase [Brumimicrobium aurantiacum]|uniref:Guanylate kinase n=1 Tax=Brumimicrobium aurantiacum TaxID=1737063 RepID=A0A3E1F0Y4_9FLAO|nr:guanylate kinase [Brumimicrobium aurantiacum]RFC55468.1 guanylate kinase [Brumimicrobium aurantiacum]
MANDQKQRGKCVIFSAPSGAGKTTIVRALLGRMDELAFSISACSRAPRVNETHKVDYYFLGIEGFKEEIEDDAFIEWEEVYKDHFYGTLKHEVDRLWAENKVVVFDVDVYGGIALKKYFGEDALSFFIQPPSIEVLEERLRNRQTETEDVIKTRLAKAEEELSKSNQFDKVVINNNLDLTIDEVENYIKEYIK